LTSSIPSERKKENIHAEAQRQKVGKGNEKKKKNTLQTNGTLLKV